MNGYEYNCASPVLHSSSKHSQGSHSSFLLIPPSIGPFIKELTKMDYRSIFNFESGEFTVNSKPLYIQEQKQDGFGTGGLIWDCGVVLLKFLETEEFPKDHWKGKRVLELGSGTGILGLGAALLGAQVCLSDEALLLDLLKQNTERNQQNCEYPPQVLHLDWNQDTPETGEWDYILCADLVYHVKVVDDLVRTLKGLANKQTTVLMAHKHRSDDVDDYLFGELQREFDIEEISLEHFHPQFQSPRVYIFLLKML